MASTGIIDVFLLALAMVAAKGGILRKSCRNEALFQAQQINMTINGSSSHIISVTTASALRYCARKCVRTLACRSFCYNRRAVENSCQLLNEKKASITSSDIISSAGWIYYGPTEHVSSRCQLSNCNHGYICQETCANNDGYTCLEINECESDPCKNGGTCIDGRNQYTCTCSIGWTGVACQENINECASNPCLFRGICSDGPASFSCSCKLGYHGVRCDKAPEGYTFGDGNGSEQHIGTFENRDECVAACTGRMSGGVAANAVTIDSATQKSCWCEWGQTGNSGSTSYINKFI